MEKEKSINKNKRLKYPLRKVISRVPGKEYLVKLECGHQMCASKDRSGEICGIRQRCIYCKPRPITTAKTQDDGE